MEDCPSYKLTTIADSFQGWSFNSLNDVVIHRDGSIWFTVPIHGYMQKLKPKHSLPSQVYRFDLATKATQVVADGFASRMASAFRRTSRLVMSRIRSRRMVVESLT
jgi:gluconolactonase